MTDIARSRAFYTQALEPGGLDILVNCAGLMLLGPIVGADTEDWRRMMSTNVLGLMYMMHASVEGMVEAGSGDIVNISSVAGRVARTGAGGYNASKWAVNAFSEAVRQEVTAKGVRVSVIEPGAVQTELNDHIAAAITCIVCQPPRFAVNEILIRPTDQTAP